MFADKTSVMAILVCSLPLAAGFGCGEKAKHAAAKAGGEIEKAGDGIEFRGKWASNCLHLNLDWLGLSSQKEELDHSDKLVKRTTLFKDDACQTALVTVAEEGDFHIGAALATDSVYELEQNFSKVIVTPINIDGTKALNAANACGIDDWSAGVAREVTAQTSENAVAARCWTKTPRVVHDIVQVGNDSLKLGKVSTDLDKSTAGRRPTEIDAERTYSRR